jgi:hypothetical protein
MDNTKYYISYNLNNKGWKVYDRCPKRLTLEEAIDWQSRLHRVYESKNEDIKTKLMEHEDVSLNIGGK